MSAIIRYPAAMDELPAPDSPLDVLVAPRKTAAGWELTFPDGWQQGRGTFGGLVLAAMARAMEETLAVADRPLRSLSAELCGPTLPGRAELRTEVLRVGNAVSTVACRVVQGSEIQAHAVGVFGKARTTDRDANHLQPPRLPRWEDVEPLPLQPPSGPDFARFFEYRSTGASIYSGVAKPVAEGWIRPKNRGARRDAAYVIACMDAWWPALLSVEVTARPMATIGYTLQLCGALDGLEPDAPWRYRSSDAVIRDGYFVEFRELWSAEGRLLALNQQTFVVIK